MAYRIGNQLLKEIETACILNLKGFLKNFRKISGFSYAYSGFLIAKRFFLCYFFVFLLVTAVL